MDIRYAADPPARCWDTAKADPTCLLQKQERQSALWWEQQWKWVQAERASAAVLIPEKGPRRGPQPWPDLLASGRHHHRYPLLAAQDSIAIARTGYSICWVSNNWTATGAETSASEHSDSSVFVFWSWYWIRLRHWPHTSCIAQRRGLGCTWLNCIGQRRSLPL